ncbi:hypothetical protein L687_04790 [Microbacterium maritypicum MF109]|uniref:Uncharacterized protein n=1 Tax=Microbacterium maritypicum MF109 TaxID=1333857 RepID=T5KF14_MICMQ|nr:hypothetical protein L687_04790 [Microbacterium maritypicum MF109]
MLGEVVQHLLQGLAAGGLARLAGLDELRAMTAFSWSALRCAALRCAGIDRPSSSPTRQLARPSVTWMPRHVASRLSFDEERSSTMTTGIADYDTIAVFVGINYSAGGYQDGGGGEIILKSASDLEGRFE